VTATRSAGELDNSARVERLSNASLRRVIEPDVDVVGRLTKPQVLPDELLSIAGLEFGLTPSGRATLAREELASIVRFGIFFEAVLMSGFAYRLALSDSVTDPRFTYALHEIGEETRHSRLFVRLFDELAPTHRDQFNSRVVVLFYSRILRLLLRRPATLDAFLIAGEEIPDRFQRLAAEHPDTDEYVRAISRYHRLEEARHLAYARMTVGEHYRSTTSTDRFAVRWIVPAAMVVMFDAIVAPPVYSTVGLPALRTWLRVRRQPARVAMRQECVCAVLDALIDADVLEPGHIPVSWRLAAGVDHDGHDLRGQDGISVARAKGPIARASALASTTARSILRPVLTASMTTASMGSEAMRWTRRVVRSKPLCQRPPAGSDNATTVRPMV
jgi:hypothetical protein